MQTGQDYAQIASGPYSVTSVNGAGTFGPLSISSPIENIKVSGIYRFNPILATGIASTMITPVPVLTLDLPLKNIKKHYGKYSCYSSIISVRNKHASMENKYKRFKD